MAKAIGQFVYRLGSYDVSHCVWKEVLGDDVTDTEIDELIARHNAERTPREKDMFFWTRTRANPEFIASVLVVSQFYW